MEVSGQLHAPAAFPPGKNPLVPLYRRLGGPQSRSGRCGEEKNSQPLPGFEPLLYISVCETWCLALREERRLRVFQTRMMREIFGRKKEV
jgi:hypothetical protein